MPNMGYCRFQNTAHDLSDCLENMPEAGSLDTDEAEALADMVDTCASILVQACEAVGVDPRKVLRPESHGSKVDMLARIVARYTEADNA